MWARTLLHLDAAASVGANYVCSQYVGRAAAEPVCFIYAIGAFASGWFGI
jgi:hypothetical protein